MGYEISPDLEDILQRVRDFMVSDVYPLEHRFLHEDYTKVKPEVDKLRAKTKKLGLSALQMPKDVGGGGLHFLKFGRVMEEMGKSPLGLIAFNSQAPDAGNMEMMHAHASEKQKEQFLLPLVRGDIRSCFTMTEPNNAGSNPVIMSTTAVKDGNEWVINGRKWFASAIDGAGFAICMAVTNPEAPPHQRASMFFVPLPAKGLEILRNISVMGHAGHDFFSHSEIQYTNVRVPNENMLGNPGEGFKLAQVRLGPGRIHHCMRWIGICERSLDIMVRRAKSRKLSPERSLADQQTIQNWIAESRAEIDAARLLVLNAAEAIDKKGAENARVEISCIKIFVPEVMMKVIDRTLQTHGAMGMTDDTIVSWWYRHERGSRIYDGPDEVHKSVIARALIKAAV